MQNCGRYFFVALLNLPLTLLSVLTLIHFTGAHSTLVSLVVHSRHWSPDVCVGFPPHTFPLLLTQGLRLDLLPLPQISLYSRVCEFSLGHREYGDALDLWKWVSPSLVLREIYSSLDGRFLSLPLHFLLSLVWLWLWPEAELHHRSRHILTLHTRFISLEYS